IEYAGGRGAADLLFELTFADGHTLAVPVNVKWNAARSVGNDAVAVTTLLKVAQGRRVDDPGTVRVERTILEWHAGRVRIQPGDYYLLDVLGDKVAGRVLDHHFQGLLSSVRADGRLAIHRQAQRATI